MAAKMLSLVRIQLFVSLLLPRIATPASALPPLRVSADLPFLLTSVRWWRPLWLEVRGPLRQFHGKRDPLPRCTETGQ
jgi:hypothetical protein